MTRQPLSSAFTRPVALLLLSCLCVAGVSTSSCGDSVEKRQPLPVPANAVRMAGEPGVFGGTFTVAVANEITSFNPFLQSDPATASVLRLLYAPLVGYDAVNKQVLPEEGLAKFEVNGTKVTIKLREGLSFSDGTPIRADDVVYSLRIAMDKDVHSPLADMLAVSGRLPKVTKVDDTTVDLEFVDRYPQIGYVFTQLPVVSAGKYASDTIAEGKFAEALSAKTNPASIACSGPFKLGAYEKGKSITLDYNPHYWKVDSQGNRLPYFDHITFNFGMSSADVAKGLKDKKINLAEGLLPADFTSLGASGPGYLTQDLKTGFGAWALVLNVRADSSLLDPVTATHLRRPKLREAIAHSVDRDRIVRDVFKGMATVVYGPVSPGNEEWSTRNVKQYQFDPAAAQAAIDADTFPDGGQQKKYFHMGQADGRPQLYDPAERAVHFTLYYPKDDIAEEMQKIVVAQLATLGIPVKPISVDPGKFMTQRLAKGAFDLALCRVDGNLGADPISYMPLFMSNGAKHYHINTAPDADVTPDLDFEKQVNRLMRSQQEKPLVEERKQDFYRVQQLFAQNVPMVFIAADNVLLATSKLGNFKPVKTQPHVLWNAEQLFYKP
jgi:peptide/nickel transport system substrate-binding protein